MSKKREKFERLLLSSVSNLAMSFADSYIEKNVERRASAGLKATVIRRQLGKCCDWCQNLAGIYTADKLPADIYKRHANCRCMVTYKTEKLYTDAWSKKQFATEKEARLEREKEIKAEAAKREAEQKELRLELDRKVRATRNKENVERQRKEMLAKEKEILEKKRQESIINTGAKGALNDKNDPNGKRRRKHAAIFYESLRNSDKQSFVERVANNTGIDKNIISNAYKHVFEDKHMLSDGFDYFFPDYDMAESWRRLSTNDKIQNHDLILLKHEDMEYKIMQKNPKMSYNEAHAITEEAYNYAKALKEWKEKHAQIQTNRRKQ